MTTENQAGIIYSMTGFGRATGQFENTPLTIEIKSVNHRYSDIRVKIPQELGGMEQKFRQKLQESVSRGRVELQIRFAEGQSLPLIPELNVPMAKHYQSLFHQLSEELQLPKAEPSIEWLVQQPGVLTAQPPEELGSVQDALLETLQDALKAFLQMRQQEGEHLKQDLLKRLGTLQGIHDKVFKRAPQLPKLYQEKLKERLEELTLPNTIQEDRLHQEVAIWADKSDITEELTRLNSHIVQFRDLLGKGGVVGRRLDFICQEFLREANTIGSKNQDAEIGSQLIPLKAEIEKIREQSQNIE